jgi:sugar transferase (PEP-CTERM/EpsH1 system associated)
MEHLLYLVHRIPYPPNKGDKIRSFNLLRYLSDRYRVHMGCFIDSSEDAAHAEELSRWCADLCAVPLDPREAKLRSLSGLLSGEALTLPYYRSARLQVWVDRTVATHGIARAVVFSSPMAQYLRRLPQLRTVVDLVDVDSAKWTSYAEEHRWPLSMIYRREGRRLLAFEREAVARAAAGVLVTQAEVRLFDRLAPECSARMHAIENGVDSEFFAPSDDLVSPYGTGEVPIVFTGVMDYWPNIDAVTWFAREVLPTLAQRRPDVRFYIVGMNPTPAVRALAADRRIIVTGKVPDVRPYLQHAAAVVAPLRVARGVQNKVLEAMSMARPVVVSTVAAMGIAAECGVDFEAAADAAAFVERTLRVLDAVRGAEMGRCARARIGSAYRWDCNLARFGELLDDAAPKASATSRPAAAPAAVALAG